MAMKPGERRLQILQTLATMLEHPRCEKVTTAALASRLDVSEAALYRHFASKAQMFEGLIEFIESTLFSLVNKINADTQDGVAQSASRSTASHSGSVGWTGCRHAIASEARYSFSCGADARAAA